MALYAFDGTWNEAKDGEDTRQRNTNVVRFKRAYSANSSTEDFYVAGVGTRFDALGRALGGVFGLGELPRIEEAYDHLCRRWAAGDHVIDIVGFSRGAATTLDFCHWILKDGIRKPGHGSVVEPSPQIRFLGVWDVVAAFGLANLGNTALNTGHHLSIPRANLRYCFHALALDESGMSVRDGAGWHHLWCTVNEGIRLADDARVAAPPDWRLVGSRQVVATAAQVVLESEHRLDLGASRLAMHRRATFLAGQPFFRLDVRYTNLGDRPAVLTYGYGDEPWVGRFGTADANVGWLRDGLVERAGRFSTRVQRWAGVVDRRSGLANFIAWDGPGPDLVYFNNHGGPPSPAEAGAPLASNEISIGLEWQQRRLEPGGALAVQLVIGLAAPGPGGLPSLPEGALGARR